MKQEMTKYCFKAKKNICYLECLSQEIVFHLQCLITLKRKQNILLIPLYVCQIREPQGRIPIPRVRGCHCSVVPFIYKVDQQKYIKLIEGLRFKRSQLKVLTIVNTFVADLMPGPPGNQWWPTETNLLRVRLRSSHS